MSRLLAVPRPIPDPTTGLVLNGALITTYVAGSNFNTLKATYPTRADGDALTNQNPNPCTTNAAGLFVNNTGTPIELWGLNDTAYDVKITDSTGATTIWQQLNITGVFDNRFATTDYIYDTNNKKLLGFTGVGSAINWVNITNSTTGNAPSVNAAGGDTNIDLTFNPKGTGYVNFGGSGPKMTILSLFNGSSKYVALTAPNSMATSLTFVLPNADGTAGQAIVTDGSKNLSFTSISGLFKQVVYQVFTSSGTYTPTSKMAYCHVDLVGGGGGGGGAANASGTAVSVGGGGGGGGRTIDILTAATIGSSQTVTIGAAGTAGAAGGTGGTGGQTSLGALLVANGGLGGAASGAATGAAANGGSGGAAGSTTGAFNGAGSSGTSGFGFYNSYPNSIVLGGQGGSSAYGGGGRGGVSASGVATGGTATGYGAGGGGGANAVNNTGTTGAAGTAGIMIITEYIAS